MKNVNQRHWRGLLCILLFFYGQLSFAGHHQRTFPGINSLTETTSSASLTKSMRSDYTQPN